MSYRIAKVSAVVAVALGAAWAGSTWYGGHEIARLYPEAAARMKEQLGDQIKFVVTHQQTGFLHSRVDWALTFQPDPCTPDKTLSLHGYDDVDNGPIPSGGWGRVTTHIIWPKEIQPELAEAFNHQEPITLVSTVSLLGVMTSQLKSPVAHWGSDGLTLDWLGLQGTMTRNLRNDHVSIQVNAPGIDVNDPHQAMSVKLTQIGYEFNGIMVPTSLSTGDGKLAIKSFGVEHPHGQFGATGIQISSKATNENGFYGLNLRYLVDAVQHGQEPVGKLDLALNVQHVDATGLSLLIKTLNHLSGQCKPSREPVLTAMQPILQKGMSVKLDHLDIDMLDGKAHADGTAVLPALSAEESRDPRALMAHVTVDGAAKVTLPLLQHLFKVLGGPQTASLSPEQLATMVDQIMAKPLAQGLVVKTADGFSSHLAVQQGHLLVNDVALK